MKRDPFECDTCHRTGTVLYVFKGRSKCGPCMYPEAYRVAGPIVQLALVLE